MTKKFIVIRYKSNYFEVTHSIEKRVFTLEEITNQYLNKILYRVGSRVDWDEDWVRSKEEALEDFRKEYDENPEWYEELTFDEAVEELGGISTRHEIEIETYEIMNDNSLKFRKDLSTYEKY